MPGMNLKTQRLRSDFANELHFAPCSAPRSSDFSFLSRAWAGTTGFLTSLPTNQLEGSFLLNGDVSPGSLLVLLPLWVLAILFQSLSRVFQIRLPPPALHIKPGGSLYIEHPGDPRGRKSREFMKTCWRSINFRIWTFASSTDTGTGRQNRRISDLFSVSVIDEGTPPILAASHLSFSAWRRL